jgi:hypothetical protein
VKTFQATFTITGRAVANFKADSLEEARVMAEDLTFDLDDSDMLEWEYDELEHLEEC